MNTTVRMAVSSVFGLATFCFLLFVPAGTLHYWQGWAFIGVFTFASIVPTTYFARKYPAALQRRLRAGPRAETRTAQKIIITCLFVNLVVMMAFSALDHRMGWSTVPAWVSVLGDVLVAVGLTLAMMVVVQNNYAGATVTVEAGQQLASGGLYRFVRHPMYVGNVVMMVGMPLALGSYWGVLFVVPNVAVLIFRILDEEKLLIQQLPGYREYAQRVRYRLVPNVW